VRFEGFHLDLRAGELCPDGGKAIRLPEQPFRILTILVEHPGEVVTREELRKRLWPNDTIVEFEHSISAAMNRLRQALGDSAENARYVETLARRGYRWMVPVEWIERPAASLAVDASAAVKSCDDNLIAKKVSHYRVLKVLGGGGMGIVYEAEDLKLGRRVALKFLPEELATDVVALQRFEREAQAASALDHPNICTIHEFGEHEGQPFLVMQLLEGRTVREHVAAAGPGNTLWPIETLLDLAIQIADGLDAAHRQGIIHRDIKPANIFITNRGEAKILDFGVAKLVRFGEQPDNVSVSTSSESRVEHALGLTMTGRAMGTASYMSPEQVRGGKLDARTDLFSLGLVLYEMATTQRAFPGETASRVHEAILQNEPFSPRVLNTDIPSGLEKIIGKCLEKDREVRYQSAADLRADLKQLQRDAKSVRMTKGTRSMTGTVAVAVVVVAGIAGWELLRNPMKASLGPVKVVPLVTNSGLEGRPAFSPDGSQVAFMWNGGEEDQFDIYVKLIGDGSAPVRLTRSPGVYTAYPVWSPDGHRIAFIRCSKASQAIFVIPSLGGTDRKAAELRSCPDSVDWSPDGTLLAFEDKDSGSAPKGIFLVSFETGKRRKLTTPASLENDSLPKFAPNGKTIAFVRSRNPIVDEIFLVPVDGGEPKQLTSLHGFVPGLTWNADGGEIVFSETSRDTGNNSLWRVKVPGGTPEKVNELAGVNATEPAISRHDYRLAYRTVTTNTNIWQIRLTALNGRSSAPAKFISSNRTQEVPQYSPDGKKIAFASDRSGGSQIWACDSDASNPVQLTFMDASNNGTPRWSPDGRTIVFDSTASGNIGIYTISADGGAARPLVADSHLNAAASFSRDGNWVYFVSDRSGEYEVWKVLSGGGQPVQVTFQGGWMPMESTDGKLLYYVKTNLPTDPSGAPATLWAMPVRGGKEHLVTSQLIRLHWAVAPNGIYFTDQDTRPHATLKFLDVRTGRITTIAALEKQPSCCGQSLAVSPDGRSILYSQQDSVSTDIMLVENFR
jgi:Tol biopolymer transport system component/serine/threonine protein kinase